MSGADRVGGGRPLPEGVADQMDENRKGSTIQRTPESPGNFAQTSTRARAYWTKYGRTATGHERPPENQQRALSREKRGALCRTRTGDPFLTMTQLGMSVRLRIPIYSVNPGFRGSGAGGCGSICACCGFQRVSTGRPRSQHPMDLRRRQPARYRRHEFAHLRDDERGRIGFALGHLSVGALEHRLQTHCPGAGRGEGHGVVLGLPQ